MTVTRATNPDLSGLRYPSWRRAARELLSAARRGPVPLADALSVGGLSARSANRVVEYMRGRGLLTMTTRPILGVVVMLGPRANRGEPLALVPGETTVLPDGATINLTLRHEVKGGAG